MAFTETFEFFQIWNTLISVPLPQSSALDFGTRYAAIDVAD